MRRRYFTVVVSVALFSALGCHGRSLRRPCGDDCPPSSSGGSGRVGDSGRLGEPIPGSRIPPPNVPLGSESRNSLDPFGPDGRRYQPTDPRRVPPADLPLSPGELPPRG